jgi:periplasmic copper chaperone A
VLRRRIACLVLSVLTIATAHAEKAAPQDATKSADQTVSVSKAWTRATPGGSTIGAAYVTLSAQSNDVLLSVSTPVAARAEIHTHIEDDGVMKMRKIEKIAISAGTERSLKPGGDHIMLFDLKEPMQQGETIPLTLNFEKAGSVTVTATVESVGAQGVGTTAAGSGVDHSSDGDGSDHGAGSDHGQDKH